MNDQIETLLDAALLHVPFDGWSDEALKAAASDAGIDLATARALFPRGGVDLALAYHRRGDSQMAAKLASEDLSHLRFRDRIATAVRTRIEVAEDRELVRRGTTLFALPPYAPDGARAIWGTVDLIWTTLGDTSTDYNWYTKRATLAGVYSSTVLYWLGDDSPDAQATWNFLDRRIDGVMQFERVKGAVEKNPALRAVFAGPRAILSCIKAPVGTPKTDLPGYVTQPPRQQG
ncbi:COQ9 family protein [Roseinatronobacter bogoriensis]|uniref:COQ9 family protein n=1 Tax=Roseinatronobacter bogoriensis subsp. barguzinensis TaxID=441209 RepID=A0A2K8KEA6_9RHOB|nr:MULTISPECIES: COQ9 family protein [Rhodobaca]ATX67777.1 COQ9 family protein [Rhodobaca barguzinensis]MBB4208097.1 ubiquinone biosynthesis protein COQ9 [Rhodobaca bogoriensis DSM 18756]TDW38737.1 ubiquinone biosynthesis protein COQ9 [Rhodobaca barguzinensis]TDY69225.1 ubiquinone biosynthesis protein COQ9 [Rhodobaca bogoriensis DSM 18756]